MAKRLYRTTEKRIAKLVAEGRGRGHGSSYTPWVKIYDLSSLGRAHRRPVAGAKREAHFLSDIEEDIYLRFERHPDVVDIREQYPLPRAETILIAEELGVRHPADRGVDVIMSTDLVIDFKGGRRVAIAAKPEVGLASVRTLEKLEIEKAWWGRGAAAGLPPRGEWHLVTNAGLTRAARLNDQELTQWRNLDETAWLGVPQLDERAPALMLEIADSRAGRLLDAVKRAEADNGWVPGTGLSLIKHCLANGALTHVGAGRLDPYGPVSQLAFPHAEQEI